MLTDTQREIARIEAGLYKIEDALAVVESVYALLFQLRNEPASAAPALGHALQVGEKALVKARRRLARLKEKMGPAAV